MKILVINGPNLQLLGRREVSIYGSQTLAMICADLTAEAGKLGAELSFLQSNSEGEIVDRIGMAQTDGTEAIIINPAAYSHTSVAILDALRAVHLPTIEVHLSNIFGREEYRHCSITAAGATGLISGLGAAGYLLALRALARPDK